MSAAGLPAIAGFVNAPAEPGREAAGVSVAHDDIAPHFSIGALGTYSSALTTCHLDDVFGFGRAAEHAVCDAEQTRAQSEELRHCVILRFGLHWSILLFWSFPQGAVRMKAEPLQADDRKRDRAPHH